MSEAVRALSGAEYALLLLVMGAITFATRAVPFVLFGHRRAPDMVLYLGKVMPPAVMAMLVIYCLKDINFTQYSFGAPELIACAIVVGLHLWKRNALLSIFAGTAATWSWCNACSYDIIAVRRSVAAGRFLYAQEGLGG